MAKVTTVVCCHELPEGVLRRPEQDDPCVYVRLRAAAASLHSHRGEGLAATQQRACVANECDVRAIKPQHLAVARESPREKLLCRSILLSSVGLEIPLSSRRIADTLTGGTSSTRTPSGLVSGFSSSAPMASARMVTWSGGGEVVCMSEHTAAMHLSTSAALPLVSIKQPVTQPSLPSCDVAGGVKRAVAPTTAVEAFVVRPRKECETVSGSSRVVRAAPLAQGPSLDLPRCFASANRSCMNMERRATALFGTPCHDERHGANANIVLRR